MKYEKRVVIRVILAIIVAFNINIFYKIFSPLTLHITKLTLSAYNPIISGNLIFIKNQILEFIPACTAASAYILIASIILLTDISFKKMLKTFIAGSLIILGFNIIRIDILIYILLNYKTNLFDKLHFFFWYILSTLWVFLTWIFLTKIYKIKEIPIYTDIKKLNKLRK